MQAQALSHVGKMATAQSQKGRRGNGRTAESLDWTRMQRLKAIMEREQRLKAVWTKCPNCSPRTPPSSCATQRGCCPSKTGGMPNSRTAASSLTSRIITHVLICAVLRRMSSVTLVYVFPSLLRLSASCCHYVNPFPLPLGAWTSAWNHSAPPREPAASR